MRRERRRSATDDAASVVHVLGGISASSVGGAKRMCKAVVVVGANRESGTRAKPESLSFG